MNYKRILLVDDIEMNQVLVKEMLRDRELELVTACSGEEAVQRTLQQKFDLILMDIQMPVLNGPEATRIIRGDKTNPNNNIPIIAFSANTCEPERTGYLEAGMNDVLTKFCDAETLFQKVAEYLFSPVPYQPPYPATGPTANNNSQVE